MRTWRAPFLACTPSGSGSGASRSRDACRARYEGGVRRLGGRASTAAPRADMRPRLLDALADRDARQAEARGDVAVGNSLNEPQHEDVAQPVREERGQCRRVVLLGRMVGLGDLRELNAFGLQDRKPIRRFRAAGGETGTIWARV